MDPVQEIKSRLSIVDIVSQYCQLKKAGRNFKANCPFHQEKTPSFIVSPERQFAWCFGCQTGGDIFKVVELVEGVDFKEALKILADKAGIELPQNYSGGAKKEKREKLTEINETAADFFERELSNSLEAQKYLQERGLKSKTIKEWRIGFAPNGYENLFPKLLEKFEKKDVIEAGVAGAKEMASDQLFDKFRSRIIFPIENHRGGVVAFTGRILGEGDPKYLNSSESPIFEKGAILFGFNKARDAIRNKKTAIIVEGQMDVIACRQAGFQNVVASSGTALTEMHLNALKNLVDSVIFCFDADQAGVDSTRRALEIAAQKDVTAKIIVLPKEFKDPDDVIKKDPQIFTDAILKARVPIDFFFEIVYRDTELTNISFKKKVAREMLTYARNLVSAVEREDFIHQLGLKLRISVAALSEELGNLPQISVSQKEEVPLPVAEKFTIEDSLLGLVLAFPEIAEGSKEDLEKASLQKEENLKIWNELLERNFEELKETSEYAEKHRLFTSDKYADFSDERIKKEILALAERLSKKSLEDEKHELKKQIDEAERAGNEEKAAELFEKYQKLLGK